jgi:hypothetical protein
MYAQEPLAQLVELLEIEEPSGGPLAQLVELLTLNQ